MPSSGGMRGVVEHLLFRGVAHAEIDGFVAIMCCTMAHADVIVDGLRQDCRQIVRTTIMNAATPHVAPREGARTLLSARRSCRRRSLGVRFRGGGRPYPCAGLAFGKPPGAKRYSAGESEGFHRRCPSAGNQETDGKLRRMRARRKPDALAQSSTRIWMSSAPAGAPCAIDLVGSRAPCRRPVCPGRGRRRVRALPP